MLKNSVKKFARTRILYVHVKFHEKPILLAATDTKGGNSNFYNKLRKSGLELETLGSDTMLSFMH
jgi:hypothetical protein